MPISRLSRDNQIKELLKFYKCYRAYVRGKVGCFKFDDPYISEDGKKADPGIYPQLFRTGRILCTFSSRPVYHRGLVGSGKSTLSQALAKRLGLTVISSDIVRKQLASIPATEHRFEEMESGIYSAEFLPPDL